LASADGGGGQGERSESLGDGYVIDGRKGDVEGSLVLIHYQDRPTVYARIEDVKPDVKKDWYQVTLLLLTIPAKNVTWILREEYIRGASFTMGGQTMKLEGVPACSFDPKPGQGELPPKGKGAGKSGKVLPFKR